MMGAKHNGGPKYLNELTLESCSTKLGPEFCGFFSHLRKLKISDCSWGTLPDNMEHLTSLKDLTVDFCRNIRSLPRSLEHLRLHGCNEMLMRSCTTVGDPDWEKLQHVPDVYIDVSNTRRQGGDESPSRWRIFIISAQEPVPQPYGVEVV
ncbi:putative disease resistance protein RGA4 [Hordeum vulgare subsp. vulgare]|uniref:putative disease resistance protein RGA4 n=1 Tax=Hordeum vulgare subsp. vulgare TaxID=112509 RepID=UPI001D1A56C6|nr:putative disease resistance protein RGA4 [Hordeum vulgare subsp. vulgare]